MFIEKIEAAPAFDFKNLIQMKDTTVNDPNSLTNMVTSVIDILLFVAGALAVIYLIYSGILYITAAGNPDAAKKGQQGILNAVIGIVIIVLAYFIASSVAAYVKGA